MFGRRSTSTTRSNATATTGAGSTAPVAAGTTTTSPRRHSRFARFHPRRLHPDHTNPALRAKVNDPLTSNREAKEAQAELSARNEPVPKRSLGTKMKRLSYHWRKGGMATSKATPATATTV